MGKIIIIAAVILALTVLTAAAVGTYFVSFAIRRKDKFDVSIMPEKEREITPEKEERKRIIAGNTEAFRTCTEAFMENTPPEIVSITSADGLRLESDFFRADSRRYALLIHGYQGNRTQMRHIDAVYSSWGYSVLTPDNRAHGRSDGKWIGMGWLDKDDILRWIGWITERDEDASIVLHGISMGGAAVMMTSGLELPDNVKAAVEDCGYTSAWDIFRDELRALYSLPSFPVLNMYSIMSRIIAGYSPREASSLKMLEKSAIPMLFIHGGDDSFVGTYMLDINYEAKKTGYKEKLIIEDAGHAEAYLRDPEKYFSTVKAFLLRFV